MSGPGISNLTAAQLSASAYPGGPQPPAGWTAVRTKSIDAKGNISDGNAGTMSVTVFVNDATKQVVTDVRGSDNFENFRSDILNSGGDEWTLVKPLIQDAMNC